MIGSTSKPRPARDVPDGVQRNDDVERSELDTLAGGSPDGGRISTTMATFEAASVRMRSAYRQLQQASHTMQQASARMSAITRKSLARKDG